MADNYSSVFHVKNFSASNNLRFKYSMPVSSRLSGGAGSSSYSKALNIVPYTSSVKSSSLRSPSASPSSSSSFRHLSTPLPSLKSLSVATESLLLGTMKSSLISPGSSRAVRYSRSSSASVVNGSSSLEVQRVSSSSYALLPGGGAPAVSPSSTSHRSPLAMYPIVSKSFFRYRHTYTRAGTAPLPRRCGSADPEIYRRIGFSRQISNESTIPITGSHINIERKSLSQSRSQTASCSNSRSGSMDRYTNRHTDGGLLTTVDAIGKSGGVGLQSRSRESSYSALSCNGNGNNNDVPDSVSSSCSTIVNGASTKSFPCVTELARNVASHQWETTARRGDDDRSSSAKLISCNGNGYANGIDERRVKTTSRQSNALASSDADTSSTTSLMPMAANGLNGTSTLVVATSAEGVLNNCGGGINGTAIGSVTARRISRSTKTSTHTTDIIDMKVVNGFVHLTNGAHHGSSVDRLTSSGKSARQRIRLAKLQNKYGVFKSWLTPEDEQTLARAEARLAARRQARAEAREIRMKELEKQQKEIDDNADRHYDMYSTGTGGGGPTAGGGGGGGGGGDVVNRAAFRVALGSHRGPTHSVSSASYHSSRRSSEDSSEDGMVNIRDMRHELKELEDKFRKSMVHNAQLDNEKSALTYQVELLKDKIEDLEESLTLLQREYRDKCRDFENLKRLSTQIKDELEYCKAQLLEKEELIKEYGLVVVENEVEVDIGNGEKETRIKRSLVTQETAQVLSSLGSGSLDVRLKRFLEDKNDLLDQIRRLTIELEEERNKHSKGDRGGAQHSASNSSAYTNGPDESLDAHKDASKQLADYRFKTQKYEQEIATLQANVARLDGQVLRFKTAAEEAEAREDDLKIEKRKLQRELREAQSKLDELETTNSHLQKRLDKLKTAKSTLLKEL